MMWRSSILTFLIFLVEQSRLQSIQFLEAPSDALVAPSSNHTLKCNVSSVSPVTITWFKDDMKITLDGQHLTTRRNGTELIITGVDRPTDEGSYYCKANSSSLGSVRSLEVRLRVAHIDPQPSSNPIAPIIDVLVGNFSILSCPLPASIPAVTVEWLRGAENVLTISADNRFSIYSNETTSLLIISHFVTEDGSTYECIISNNLVPGVSYTQRIANINAVSQGAIASLQHSFVVKPQDVEVVVGMTVKLQCFVTGQPVPRISWQKDNVTISSPEQSGRVLIIRDVQSSDAGVYICISVQDGFDNITATATVSVIVPPRITAGVQYMEALVGDTVQLSCMAEGSSPITWEWRHNTVVVNNNGYYSVNGRQLNITNGQLNHSGIYQCIASHSIGGQDASNNNVNLTTKPPSFLPDGRPKDLLGIINSTVVLMCNATGAPSPQYVWLKDEIVFDTLSSPRFTMLENSGSLQITSLQKSDAGVYRCNASNIARSISSDNSVLQVLDQPSILYQPTNFTVVQNNSVNIPCGIVVTGAEVEYFWLLNNNQLNLSSSRYTMREGNITVTNVQAEDNGTYECLANLSVTDNMADDLQLPIGSGIISVIFLPGIVGMPAVSEIRSRDVLVTWTRPLSDSGSPPTHYIIERRLVSLFGTSLVQDDTNWMRINTSMNLTSRVISLSPYAGYQFRVTAENVAGSGPPSLSSMVAVTLEAAPTTAPSMVTVETRSELTELLVSWMAPVIRLPDGRGRNGIITNYSVIYQLDDDLQPEVMVVTDNNRTSLVLQGLMDSSVYRVMVAASTKVGIGPYTVTATGTTLQRAPQPLDPPGMVSSNIVNSTTVTLQWTEPPLTTILNITEYWIMYRHPARENDRDILRMLPGNKLNITIGGLDGGQLYLFNVSAVNMNVSGLPLVYAISTPIGSPTHILTFNGSRLSTNAVSLHWDAPPNGGSKLYGFKIEGYSIYEREWLQLAVLPANVTDYHLNASDGMIYVDFRISAFNQYGCSEIIVFEVGEPVMPKEDAPDTLWFLVIFVLFGLFLVAFGFLIVTLMSRKCYQVYSSGRYFFRDTDDSEIASSAPSTATFSNYDVRSHKASNIPLFSSETAPFSDSNQLDEAPSSRTRSPVFSATDNSRSRLMAHGYPAPTSNPDGSTLTSGFSIDRPMFSDSTTVTSGESSGPFGHAKDYYHTPTPQQMPLKEYYSHKTKSSESDASTYI